MGASESKASRRTPQAPQPAPAPAPPLPEELISAHDRAVLELKVQRDKLKQYQRRVTAVMARETEVAREMVRQGNREMARLALQKRKYQQGLLDTSAGQIMNLEEMVMKMDNAAMEAQVVAGLRAGNEVLTRLNKELCLDDVEKLMAETAEAVAYQQEISQRLGASLTSEQETSAEDELDALLAEVTHCAMPAVPTGPVILKDSVRASHYAPPAEEEDVEIEEEDVEIEEEKERVAMPAM